MTNFQLKLIAMATMLADHIGVVLMDVTPMAIYLRIIGRVAFPLFVFLIAQGCLHTRDMRKYLLRLTGFAGVSQLPFVWLLQVPIWQSLNIFFTLAMGVASVWLLQATDRSKLLHLTGMMLGIGLLVMLANFLNVDYGGTGVIFILWLYYVKAQYPQAKYLVPVVVGLAMLALYQQVASPFFMAGMLSVIPMWLYNNRLGFAKAKWAFYAFYPVHLLILSWIR